MKITNMTSSNGNKVANQFIISDDNVEYFQSYSTIIVKKTYGKNPKVELDINAWDFSKTTGKYRNIFLGESKKETEKKIASGEYQLVDLNN
jgi:hypothetical protein